MILTVAFIACITGKLPQQSKKLRKKIEDTIKISKSTLTLTLLDLGYKYKTSGDNRRLLYDQRSVINDRSNYLRKIRKFREDGYEIVYLDALKKQSSSKAIVNNWVMCNCLLGEPLLKVF